MLINQNVSLAFLRRGLKVIKMILSASSRPNVQNIGESTLNILFSSKNVINF
jgi:hypothetical protein